MENKLPAATMPKADCELQSAAFRALRQVMTGYAPMSDATWSALQAICSFRTLAKHDMLYSIGELPRSYAFVYQGLLRAFVLDEQGNEYNKNFFAEGSFPGAMTALLTATPSRLGIEALEPTKIIEINFNGYRQLLQQMPELMLFQIHYLEKNWLLSKDAREIEIVQQDATRRYQLFMQQHGGISQRLAQYHIASHLGITATQLSRIRKKMRLST